MLAGGPGAAPRTPGARPGLSRRSSSLLRRVSDRQLLENDLRAEGVADSGPWLQMTGTAYVCSLWPPAPTSQTDPCVLGRICFFVLLCSQDRASRGPRGGPSAPVPAAALPPPAQW